MDCNSNNKTTFAFTDDIFFHCNILQSFTNGVYLTSISWRFKNFMSNFHLINTLQMIMFKAIMRRDSDKIKSTETKKKSKLKYLETIALKYIKGHFLNLSTKILLTRLHFFQNHFFREISEYFSFINSPLWEWMQDFSCLLQQWSNIGSVQ